MASMGELANQGIAETGPAAVEKPRQRRFSRRRIFYVAACAALAAIGWTGYRLWMMESGVQFAQREIENDDWQLAREYLSGYLKLHPDDAEAHLLMAEAFVKDDDGDSRDSTQNAIRHLQRIEAGSPLAAAARLQEARLTLLILLQPARAEQLLRESLDLRPDSYEANVLLWKLFDLTGRHGASHEFFWRAYKLSPESEHPARLRDWFLSEFYPETSNAEFHRALGVTRVGKIPVSINLLVRFRESEPEAAFVHAALARYYLEQGARGSSVELLKEAPDLGAAMHDPFYVTVLFETLLDLGEFDKAESCFDKFPEPRSGYLFWRCQGMLQQYIRDDAAAAVDSYSQSLADRSGKFDWEMMVRMSECLRKLGRLDEAARLQSRFEHLTKNVLTQEKTDRLRDELRDLENPDIASQLRDLYREFDLSEEGDAWESHRLSLMRSRPSSLQSGMEMLSPKGSDRASDVTASRLDLNERKRP
jgi:tetratricopeptide (TPR) repeat protein